MDITIDAFVIADDQGQQLAFVPLTKPPSLGIPGRIRRNPQRTSSGRLSDRLAMLCFSCLLHHLDVVRFAGQSMR
jgi:hypothetical protein